MMSFDPRLVRYTDAAVAAVLQQVAERARAVPGVDVGRDDDVHPDVERLARLRHDRARGLSVSAGQGEHDGVSASKVDEHYFDTMGIALVQGRNFARTDDEDAPRVAIVNEHFAQHYWPNANPLGKRFRLKDADNAWVEVVGVAKTSKYIFIAEPPIGFRLPAVPAEQDGADDAAWRSRPATPPRSPRRCATSSAASTSTCRSSTSARWRSCTACGRSASSTCSSRPSSRMGLMGLALAIVGLYGLVAYAASRRTREIGIRMAIGATAPTVLRMVLGQGFTLALVGLAVGLAGSVGAGRLLRAAFPTGDRSAKRFCARDRRPARPRRHGPRGVHPGAARVARESDARATV